MRVVVIGDVGVRDGMMHIGDEAMFEAMVGELRGRGVEEIIAISASPADTAERYGVEAIHGVGFSGSRDDMRHRLEAVRAVAGGAALGPAPDDPAHLVVASVATSDGVVVAGGGNLASNWPSHVFERAALGAVAERLGRPLAVSGQTIGPRLDGGDRALVAGILGSARLVGVREHASLRLAAELGAPPERLAADRDDASFLGWRDEPGGRDSDPYLLVSLSLHLGGLARDETVRGLAVALDGLAERIGAPVVFHPHFGSLDPAVDAGDELLHAEVSAAMRSPSTALQVGDPRSAARLARGAAMLVTSRYHPAVFAAPAGVPVAALTTDDYTEVKLRGVTGWWGQSGVAPLGDVASRTGADVLTAAWRARSEARAAADDLREAALAASARRFDRLVDAIS